MSHKFPYDFSGKNQSAHQARVRGSRYDFWAATEIGGTTIAARRNDLMTKTLAAHGIPVSDTSSAPEIEFQFKEKPKNQSPSKNDSERGGGIAPVALIIIGGLAFAAAVGIGFYIGHRCGRAAASRTAPTNSKQ